MRYGRCFCCIPPDLPFYTKFAPISSLFLFYLATHGQLVACHCDSPSLYNPLFFMIARQQIAWLKRLLPLCFADVTRARQVPQLTQREKRSPSSTETTYRAHDRGAAYVHADNGIFCATFCISALFNNDFNRDVIGDK